MKNTFRLLALALLAGLAACSGCHPEKREPLSRGAVTAEKGEPPRELSPLPEPPKLDIKPENVPGAGGELAVVAALPQGEMRGPIRPNITFSKPIKSLAMVEDQREEDAKHPVARIDPKLDGEWRWLGSASVEFVPKGLVPYSTKYTVTVPKGLKAIDGSELKSDYTFSFETPKLALQDVSPVRNYRWLKPDDTIKLVFNQPVKDQDLLAAMQFKVDGVQTPWKAQIMARVSIAEERRRTEEKAKGQLRRYERMGFEERGFENQQTRYEIAPAQPFPLDRKVTLTLAASLHGEQGPLPMGKDEVLTWKVFGPLKIAGAKMCTGDAPCPYGPLVIFTTNELDLKSIQGKVTVTPPVELDWERAQTWAPHQYYGDNAEPYVSIPGKFQPGTRYTVSVPAGVVDVFGQKYDQPFQQAVRTQDLPPELETGGSVAMLEAGGEPKLPVEVVNLSTLQVKGWRQTPAQLAKDLGLPGYAQNLSPLGPPDVVEDAKLSYAHNERRVHPISLSRLFEGKKTGLAAIWVDSPDLDAWYHRPFRGEREGYRVFAQVTDLAVHLKLAPKSSLAWVTRMSTGQPVAGAEVSAFDQTGKQVWTGTSNADGVADVPGAVALNLSAEYEWQSPFLLVAATKDGDTGITTSQWSEGIEPYEFQVREGWEGEKPEPTGFIFTDRGIYRPGDTVHLKGVVRYRQVGELKAPAAGSKLSLKVTDSRGQAVKESEVEINGYGTFSADVPISQDAPTGGFGIEASGSAPAGTISFSGSFRVEEYRAPQFKVDVQTDGADLVAGDPLSGHVFARYLFGGAMSDAHVKWSAHRVSTVFEPPGAPGFVFGQETWWLDDREPEEVSDFAASGEGAVNAKGQFDFQAGSVEAPGQKTYTYTVEAEVADINRQTVAGRASITVHPSHDYVGLRPPTGFRKAGEEVPVDTLVVDTHGKKVPGREVTVTFSSRTWKSIKQKDASGGFTTISEPVEEPVATCKVDSAEDPVPCAFKPAKGGFYIAKATVKDAQGHQHTASVGLYVTGPGFVAWQRNDTDRIDLVPDKNQYDVGEVAHVLVKSPYTEARALLTVEREGIFDRRAFELKGSVRTVDIPITEEMVPNVFAGVILMHPRSAKGGIETGDDPGRPAVRVGLVKLNVERKVKRLSVAVTTPRPEYRPAEPVQVDLAVKDAAGKPVKAEVTVYAVDEAVLRLTNYQVPDPIAAIFPERPLSTRIGEPLLHLVRQRSFGEKGEDRGGGGAGGPSGAGSGFRSNFQTTVLFTSVETDASGEARATFKLPDNLTTFRVMAVAVTPEDRFGSGQTEIKVNKPLLALPALPRFARVGDKFEAGVVVHSYGGGTGEVTVTASVENARLLGPAEQRVQVTDATPKEVRFPFTVDQSGTATFRFKAVRGADQDGVEQKIPIELPVALEAVATYGDTQSQSVEGISPPQNARPELGGLEVTMASTALGNFQQGFQQLVEYPYGCLEQQSSRLVPFVALRELSGQFGIGWDGPERHKLAREKELNAFFRDFLFDPLDVSQVKDPDEVIRQTVASIEKLQAPSGAFNYWSDAWCPDSWASAYATLALWRAKQVGFPVNPEVLNQAEGYLGKVAGGSCSPCELTCPAETRVFASYVLARAGKPKASTYDDFFEHRNDLPLFSQALLADAMFVGGGDRVKAKQLLGEILNHAKESAQGVHFEEFHSQTYATLWHSDTRTTGVVLETLTDLAPDHPFVSKIAHYLTGVRRGDGQWRSTQEAAWSLMGLTEMVRTKERETPDFKAQLAMGSRELMEETFKGRSMAVKEKSVPMSQLLQSGKEKLTFKKEGPGVLYYSALMRYAPKDLPMTPLDQGLYVQRWFEPYSGGGQATKFYAGDLVRVRVRVATNQERHWAAFEVPLPAGLEPVDTSLATTAGLTMGPTEEQRGPGYEYESDEDQSAGNAEEEEGEPPPIGPWVFKFWTPFNHVEQRDSKVVLFADHLPPGIHVSSFIARATTPGTYLLKPASGSLMYEPEVFGRSAGGTFEVVLPTAVSER